VKSEEENKGTEFRNNFFCLAATSARYNGLIQFFFASHFFSQSVRNSGLRKRFENFDTVRKKASGAQIIQ
jgi:hypothetical protein